MQLSGKQFAVLLFFTMFVYSGIMKIVNFQKKVYVLGKKTMLPKIINIFGMIGVIILEILGSLVLVFDALYENILPENLIKFIYLLYLAFLIVVTLLYHPPSSHMIPFLSNVTTFGGMLYIFYDTFN